MSIAGLNPDIDMLHKKTFHHHHRKDSAELDVFEAARYFSGDATSPSSSGYCTRGGLAGGRRTSLDIPTIKNHHHHHYTAAQQKQLPVKDKKYKQPSSPAGKLASFLNSLFSQSTKKKSKSSAAPDDEIPGGASRKRRSSIGHFSFGSSVNSDNNRNLVPDKHSSSVSSVSSKNSGFRTPHAPTKNDLRSLSGHKQSVHCNGHETMRNPDFSWLDRENFRFRNGLSESEKKNNCSNKYDNSDRKQVFKDNYDEGAESDSSSDLFELPNYDLGDYSTGLPVYETTRLDGIKRGVPISASGP